jgi:hypothetical protein
MTKRSAETPDREIIKPDMPLRLAVAAELAFPRGGITAAGLRREAARGRLVTERIAGKDYTTLADIENMRALCRNRPKEPSAIDHTDDGKRAQDALLTTIKRIKESSKK